MTALPHVVERQIKDEISTEYVGNALQVISENTAKIYTALTRSECKYLVHTLSEIIRPESKQKAKTAEEIIADITERAGLKVVNE